MPPRKAPQYTGGWCENKKILAKQGLAGGEGGTTVPNSENRCKSTTCVAVAVEIPLLALLLVAVCPNYNTVFGGRFGHSATQSTQQTTTSPPIIEKKRRQCWQINGAFHGRWKKQFWSVTHAAFTAVVSLVLNEPKNAPGSTSSTTWR